MADRAEKGARAEAMAAVEWIDKIRSSGLGASGAEDAAREALLALLDQLDAAERVITEALAEVEHLVSIGLSRTSANLRRILTAYEKTTNHTDGGQSDAV